MADRGSRTPECMGVAADGGIIFLRGALFSDGHHKKKVCHVCMNVWMYVSRDPTVVAVRSVRRG